MMRTLRSGACIATALATAVVAAGCDGDPIADPPPRPVVGAPGVQLVAFDSCESALRELKEIALERVGPYGLPGDGPMIIDGFGLPMARLGADSLAAEMGAAPPKQHSTTNVHEAGADEPELVKTDGKRIVTVMHDGKLRIVDVTTREVTATIDLKGEHPTGFFLHGDRALVISSGGDWVVPFGERDVPGRFQEQLKLLLVDLTGDGEILDKMTVEGGYVDARSTDGVARVVIRSGPRLDFRYPAAMRTEKSRDAATERNREVIRDSEIADWLPRYRLQSYGSRSPRTLVDCSRISHPEPIAGTSLLTVLTFDVDGSLGKGGPVSITANGGTVYGNGENLYVADDDTVPFVPMPERGREKPLPEEPKTRVYQFDVSGDGPPEFVASGAVDGTLLNQYSMSEHEGHLRLATTVHGSRPGPDAETASESAVVVLKRVGEQLTEVGEVGGLGKGERIYSVRFLGDLGYLVTFREIDPLYRIDLSDPREPKVDGELKVPGYSSYLHPVGEGRLFGIGQEIAVGRKGGQASGLLASLFDISNATPVRLDRLHIPGADSSAGHDPHAFLYWPAKALVIIPVQSYKTTPKPAAAMVLKVNGDRLERVGSVRHDTFDGQPWGSDIRRSLIIGETLWTLSGAGLQANDLNDLAKISFVEFK